MRTDTDIPREPNVERDDISISSQSGTDLRATISRAREPQTKTGAILCPGFAVGKEGLFVRSMENALFHEESISLGIRFNFSGHEQDEFNTDLQGFTFKKALLDFQAVVETLRKNGAERVIVIGSSTGVQPAVLASCQDGQKADLIIGRSSVLDCFQSVMQTVPPQALEQWKQATSFQFPVGGQSVRLGSDLLDDIASWNINQKMAKLTTPVRLIHGGQDQVVPLQVVQQSISTAPEGKVELNVIEDEGHEFSNNLKSPGFRWMIEQTK